MLIGSSPLTRGKPGISGFDGLRCRLIPAHAGKTYRSGPSACGRPAHPRSRGENIADSAPDRSSRGSSPLTRGKPGGRVAGLRGVRAHPRSRGENGGHISAQLIGLGSSPLTRGKRGKDLLRAAASRLIPAHAGKTNRPELRGKSSGAHPRSRGENASPRERDCALSWLIPAHAGKTSSVSA